MNESKHEFDRALRFLMKVHNTVPGITETVLNHGKTADGRSSYEMLIDIAEPLRGKTVVDLACGSGRLTELAVESVGLSGQVIAIDLNRSELFLAKQRLHGIKQVRFLQESACDLSLPDSSVDVILCHMALMLFQPLDRALAEIARVLRPGGIWASTMPSVGGGNEAYVALRTALASVIVLDVAAEQRLALSDAEAGSAAGVKSLIARNGNFSDNWQIKDFDLLFKATPESLAERLLPFFYYSHLLSAKGKAELHRQWIDILNRELHDAAGMIEFRLPLSVFTINRR